MKKKVLLMSLFASLVFVSCNEIGFGDSNLSMQNAAKEEIAAFSNAVSAINEKYERTVIITGVPKTPCEESLYKIESLLSAIDEKDKDLLYVFVSEEEISIRDITEMRSTINLNNESVTPGSHTITSGLLPCQQMTVSWNQNGAELEFPSSYYANTQDINMTVYSNYVYIYGHFILLRNGIYKGNYAFSGNSDSIPSWQVRYYTNFP